MAKKGNEKKDAGEAKAVGSHLLNPYPTDLTEPARIMLVHFRGEEVDTPTIIHAAYQGIGVGLRQFYPDDHVTETARAGAGVKAKAASEPLKCGPDCCPDDAKVEEALSAASGEKGVRGPLSDLFIQAIISYAMKLLNEWLNK